MSNRVELIPPVSYNPQPVDAVHNYSKSGQKKLLENMNKKFDQMMEDFKFRKEVLSKYPNPQNLTFSQIMEGTDFNAASDKSESGDEEDFIVEISH